MNEPVWMQCIFVADFVFYCDLGRSSFMLNAFCAVGCCLSSGFASNRLLLVLFSLLSFFSRTVSFFVFNVADCWLHLNIVAHNLHVVYCQFYACSRCCGVLSHVIYVFCTFVLVSLFFPLAGDVLESSRSLASIWRDFFFIFVNTFCVTICTTKREFQQGKTMKKQWDQNAQQPLYRSDLDCELSATTSSIYCTDSRSHLVTLHKST